MDYDPFGDAILDDPFPVYARLRAESPVHYVEALDTWALALFEDVWNAGQDNEHFDQPGPALMLPEGLDIESIRAELSEQRGTIFMMNPPAHTDVRKALAGLFNPRGIARFEEPLRAIVRDCLEKQLASGRCDVLRDLAGQVSVRVASMIIGLPLEDSDTLSAFVARQFRRDPGVRGMPMDAMVSGIELGAYLLDRVKERRAAGPENYRDAMSAYMQAEVGGTKLEDQEVASQLVTLVVGGTETLPKVFAGGVLQLFRHPDQRAELVADPSLIPKAFVEIARYEMPTQFLTRKVAKDFELRGQQLREGQGVMLLYRSANRDAGEFDEPDRFDIHRGAPRILSFGHGTHVCLGQHAARLEARVMYEELLARVPEYEIDESEVVPARSEFVAGYLEMPITFDPV